MEKERYANAEFQDVRRHAYLFSSNKHQFIKTVLSYIRSIKTRGRIGTCQHDHRWWSSRTNISRKRHISSLIRRFQLEKCKGRISNQIFHSIKMWSSNLFSDKWLLRSFPSAVSFQSRRPLGIQRVWRASPSISVVQARRTKIFWASNYSQFFYRWQLRQDMIF